MYNDERDRERRCIAFLTSLGYKIISPKENADLKERKKRFANSLRPYLQKYGVDMLNAFYLYWTQVNEGGRKMHFEKQRTFQIPNRLAAWKRNNYGKERTPTDIGMVLQHEKDKFKDEKEW